MFKNPRLRQLLYGCWENILRTCTMLHMSWRVQWKIGMRSILLRQYLLCFTTSQFPHLICRFPIECHVVLDPTTQGSLVSVIDLVLCHVLIFFNGRIQPFLFSISTFGILAMWTKKKKQCMQIRPKLADLKIPKIKRTKIVDRELKGTKIEVQPKFSYLVFD